MGGYPPHGLGTGGVPRQIGAAIDGEAPAAADRQEMVIKLDGGDKGGGYIRGDGRVHLEKAEHYHTVHSYTITSRPV